MKTAKLNTLLLAAATVMMGTMIPVGQTFAATSYFENFDNLSDTTDIETVAGWGPGFFGAGSLSGRTVSTAQAQSTPHSLFTKSTVADTAVSLDLTDASVLGAAIGTGVWRVEFDLYPTLLTTGFEIQQSADATTNDSLWTPPIELLGLTGMDEATWNHVVFEFDFDNDLLTVDIDSSLAVATRTLVAGKSLAKFAFAPTTSATDIYIDNVSIALLPEPASLALLSLGGLMMLKRRR